MPWSLIAHIPDIPHCVSWWHGPSGHAYFSPVDDPSRTKPDEQMIEISSRTIVDPETDKTRRWSWGVPTTNEHVESHFTVSRKCLLFPIIFQTTSAWIEANVLG